MASEVGPAARLNVCSGCTPKADQEWAEFTRLDPQAGAEFVL
jgi:hypothetical protein